MIIGFFILYLWLFTRLSLVELIIGIDKISDVKKALGRSWSLTKPFVSRLLLINFIAFLITIPIYFAANIINGILLVIMVGIFDTESPLTSLIFFGIFDPESTLASLIFLFIYLANYLATNILFAGMTMPFWQSIKAAIYYDLRSQREGIDLW